METLRSEIQAASNTDLPQTEVPEIELPETIETAVEENGDDLLYEAGITALLSFSEEDNETTRQILTQSELKTSSYEDILSTDFELEGISREEVIILQNTLRSHENLIESLLHESNPNWQSLTLLEIFRVL